MISGGSSLSISEGEDPDSGQLSFEFIDLEIGEDFETAQDEAGRPKGPVIEKKPFSTNKMAVLQSKDGVFLRLRLSEVPEKKKTAIGVRGIRLGPEDRIEKVYITGFGDKTFILYHDREVELMKIKLAKRDTKGTKLRG